MRCILHVDMDAFYASVEQLDDASLRGRPVLVGGTGARGVVAAASYEAREYGCRSAMPMAEALRRCPQALCVRPRMHRYKEVSTQVFAAFREYTPFVEGLSLDEAYLDVTASLKLHGPPERLAGNIKREIRTRTGLTASVGAGPNKLVAKIASDLGKPDGLQVLFGDAIQRTLDPLSVRVIGGIGPRTAERLEAEGIRLIEELRRAPDSVLRRIFGRYAERMRARAGGQDERPVEPGRNEISISAEETFDRDLDRPERMVAEIAQLSERVSERLRRKGLQAGRIGLKIRRHDFSTFTRQRRVSPPVVSGKRLAANCVELLGAWLSEYAEARIRLLGVSALDLSPAEQLPLFDGADQRALAAGEVADRIRDRFGPTAVRRGRDLAD
jgi:DNA polymerase-4